MRPNRNETRLKVVLANRQSRRPRSKYRSELATASPSSARFRQVVKRVAFIGRPDNYPSLLYCQDLMKPRLSSPGLLRGTGEAPRCGRKAPARARAKSGWGKVTDLPQSRWIRSRLVRPRGESTLSEPRRFERRVQFQTTQTLHRVLYRTRHGPGR